MRLIKPDFRITSEHGKFFEKGGTVFCAVYHPAALLRDPEKKKDAWNDLKAVMAKMKEGATADQIYEWKEANDLRLTTYVNRNDDLEEAQTDPLLQGTNGVLTLGFVVTLILCGVG